MPKDVRIAAVDAARDKAKKLEPLPKGTSDAVKANKAGRDGYWNNNLVGGKN